MRNIFEYKFTIPPVVSAIAILLAFPEFFLSLKTEQNIGVAQMLFGGTLIILATGFLLSTISYFILNWLDEDFVKEKEWAYWGKLEGEENEFKRENVVKRWDMAIVNFNTSLGLLLVIVFSAFFRFGKGVGELSAGYALAWLVTVLTITGLTFLNGLKARRDVRYFTEKV